jgi:ECF transporter S component (folate family)
MVVCGFLTALSVVLGKYLAINLSNVLRFSFENLPIILAGVAFGPIAGAAVGVVADILGCILVGYGINPLVTLGAAAIGIISGIFRFLFNRPGGVSLFLKLLFAEIAAHLVGSVLIKTVGLSAFYDMKLEILMLWRLLNYAVISIAEIPLLYAILKNRAVTKQLDIIRGERK